MSSVAGAVVTIDGDSSGLVGALQKGEKGIADVKVEARKLSDQLREVADDADKAAGALVQNIGGPGAIKAIAGVGAAMGIAKAGVEAFLDSSENLFKSYGDEGQKVWDDTEKSLFAIKGAFAEAVLGGGDMKEMGANLKSIFDGVKTVMDALLTPIRVVASTLWDISRAAAAVTDAKSRGIEIDNQYAAAIAAVTTATNLEKESVDLLLKSLGDVYMSKQESAALEYNTTLTRIDNAIANNREAREFRANAAADLAAARAVEAEIKAGLQGKMFQARQDVNSPDSSRRVAMLSYEERARELLAADQSFQAQLQVSQNAARQAAYESMATATEAELAQERLLLDKREVYVQKAAELQYLLLNPPKPPADTGGGGPPKPVDDTVYAVQQAEGGYAKLTKVQYDALDKMQQQTGDYSQRIMEMTQAEFDGLAALGDKMYLADIARQTERDEADAERRAAKAAAIKKEEELVLQGKLDLMMEEMEAIQKAKEKEIADDKAAKALMFNLAVIQNGKLLANAIVGNKKMGEVARAALGNVASGLGDVAMVKSAEYAADGLWPQASGMAVAGTLGYTIAAALGADKKANAGPPTERQQPVQNYAYNLRIDSAFADSESISRRFAQMQEGARQRGLITAAA